ncbi:Cullin repeat-like-containing domain protein [Mycena polygramma]|nr:Cullin repeat-like-containing domain protein [Mycena polygramma]
MSLGDISKTELPSMSISDVWNAVLEPGVTQILHGTEPLTYKTHQKLYGAVYECCNRTKPAINHCRELYSHVLSFYTEYTLKITAAAPEDDTGLLEYYDAQWDCFSRGAAIVNRLFDYLNRHFVSGQRDEGRTNVETVLNVALTNWRTNVFEPLSPRLENALGGTAQLEAIRTQFASHNLGAAEFKNMHVRAV